MNHTYDSAWWNSNVPGKHWFNDDQVNQVYKVRTEYDELIQPEIEKLNTVRSEFFGYRQQDEISSKRIKEYQDQIRGIEDNIYSQRTEAGSKIRKVLTNGQKEYFNDTRLGWWDGFYDRCGWDYADMNYGMNNHGMMYNRGRCCW